MDGRLVRALLAALGLVGAALLLAEPAAASASRPKVLAIRFGPDLEINPVTQSYFTSKLSAAASQGYDAVVVELDTPGGLSTSMKKMYNAELASKLPVIVYVSPEGARAASAGVWISEAADALAMAPTTNIGSSTPIDSSGQNIGSDLRRKVVNDAVASLTALAQSHHRNTKWPAQAVRVASNLTAAQALKMHVIDAIAPTLPALLRQLDGYRTKDAQRPFTLRLAGAGVTTVSPGFFTRLLNTVLDPNLVSVLFLLGLVGLVFEVLHPGVVLPGALGAVALVLALYGFSVLNPSWGGVALMVLGVALLVIDVHAMTHGALTVAGLVALLFGMALLFQNEPAGYHVNTWLIVGIGAAVAAFWSFVLSKGVAARRQPVKMGPHLLVGAEAEVRSPGQVFVNGELWQAESDDGAVLVPGSHVRVEAVDGLHLKVHPVS
ncbi:MAG: NfeD family protein [Gaiellaceae bacterium]